MAEVGAILPGLAFAAAAVFDKPRAAWTIGRAPKNPKKWQVIRRKVPPMHVYEE
jgi:hypothetical protein